MLSQIQAKVEDIDDRYYRFLHQQRSFAEALTNARSHLCVVEPVKTLNEVTGFINNGRLERSNDIRIIETFLLICDDLEGLRKDCKRHLIDCLEMNANLRNSKSIKNLVVCMKKWRKMLDPDFDFSELRAKWPHYVVQKLSSVEAMQLYAGIVSYLPIVIDNVKLAQGFLKSVDDKSVWQTGEIDENELVSPRTNASSLSKSVANSRPPTNRTAEPKEAEVPKLEDMSRPASHKSASQKSDHVPSIVQSLPQSRKCSSRPVSYAGSRTASRVASRSSTREVRSEFRPGSVEKSVRPKSEISQRLVSAEFIDEGLAHGESEIKTPKQSRGVSRRSSGQRSASAASKTPLSSLRQKLMSNPSDISAIQEKLRSLYCKSSGSRSIPDYGGRVVTKTPPQPTTERRIAPGSARSRQLTPFRPANPDASRQNSRQSIEEVDFMRRSRTETDGMKLVVGSFPVVASKKSTTPQSEYPKDAPNKRTTAVSSQRLSNLLGYEIKSTRGSNIQERDEKSECDVSVVPSLANASLKNRGSASPLSHFSHASQKLTIPTIPHSRGTDKMWQP